MAKEGRDPETGEHTELSKQLMGTDGAAVGENEKASDEFSYFGFFGEAFGGEGMS